MNTISDKNFISSHINVSRSAKSENVPESSEKESVPDSDDFSSSQDKVSVNASSYGNEANFAHQVYNKISQTSINDLTTIKGKIDQNAYNSSDINQAVSASILKFL